MLKFDVASIASAFKPRRALLYAPGSEISKLEKASKLASLDTVSFDLEDGVPPPKKDMARRNIIDFLSEDRKILPELAIRVNSISTRDGMKDLNEVFLNPKAAQKIKTIILPKVEDPLDIRFTERWLALNRLEHVKILAMIESPMGLVRVNDICAAGKAVEGLIFGAEDFRSACGITKFVGEEPIIHARSAVVAAARAFNIQAIDMTSVDFRRPEVVEKDALISRAYGFTGKQVIHPMQIEFANKAFVPSPEEIKKLTEMIKTFVKTTLVDGKGVFGADGKMVELPHIKDAVRSLIYAGKSVKEIQDIADSVLN